MASLPLIRTIALDGCYWPTPLRMGATEVIVGETESLARQEQAAIKRRIRRTAEQASRCPYRFIRLSIPSPMYF